MSDANRQLAQKKLHEKAEALVKNANYQHYTVFHPALLATLLQDGTNLVDLEREIAHSFAEVLFKKALLVVALVTHILHTTEGPYWHFANRCLSLLLDLSVLPKHCHELSNAMAPSGRSGSDPPQLRHSPPDTKSSGILRPLDCITPPLLLVMYCATTPVMYVMWHLQHFGISFLNLYSGDDLDGFTDRMDAWKGTPNVPALIILAGLATGINITQANILIFAQMSYNKLKDMQVKGRIYRTSQAHKCFIYKL
ncbi:hypothetical protein sr15793 [Sporisorium reilianum SRZ2]|uniref:Helicase C-terminal domain-containing protein n=1 Tax=Sporisorium reilianum (strain SRZ2) TaxID=999809 RepID=E6ZQ21_SPORE|nr:hypothetical protein sr15793 [Sporisorium reilianum SRZ2]